MKKYKNIAYTTSAPLKNRGNFLDYLLEEAEVVIVFCCTQGYSSEKSYVERYINGVKEFKKEFPIIRLKSKAFLELSNSVYLGYTLLRFVPRKSILIVDNPFFIFSTRLASYFKSLNLVFWIGDYFPSYKGALRIYNALVNYYNKNLKFVLYVSPPIQKIYRNNLNKDQLKDKYRALVSFGFDQKPMKKKRPKEIKLGFIGVIRKMQGLDLVFELLQNKKEINISLDIIGDGHDLDFYKKLAKDMKLNRNIKFYGHVENIDQIVKSWDLGIALYENKPDNYSIYCEPTKIKDYLSYGLPVITTDTTYMHKEIKKFHAGEIVQENVRSLSLAVQKIIKKYDSYLEGVARIGNEYEYQKWYERKFKFLESI